MTDAPAAVPPDDPLDLAAEYALGVLDADEHRAAEARAGADPAFAAEALAWSERLSPLLEQVAAVAPSAGVWEKIEARLQGGGSTGAPVDLADRRRTAADSASARRLGAWRTTALGAMAAALACLLALGFVLFRPAQSPPAVMLAELQGEGGAAPLLATYDPLRRAMLVSLPAGTAPNGRSPELWLIDASGKPAALGVAASGGVSSLRVSTALAARMKPDVILAVSIEPLGGSTTGAPTGPVVAKGALHVA